MHTHLRKNQTVTVH